MGTLARSTTLTVWHAAGKCVALMVRCAPGRTRTDTSDPFRGAASALGLRGLANNTLRIWVIEGPIYSAQRLSPDSFIWQAINRQ
jgi:hypothetical protein